jgi:formylglycine-generating enzyme required for sulfatase activity
MRNRCVPAPTTKSARRLPFKMKHFFTLLLLVLAIISVQSLHALAGTPAALSLQLTNGCPRVCLSGVASNACTVQFATNLNDPFPWHFLTNFVATNNQAAFMDTNRSLTGNPVYYRAFTQVLPPNVVAVSNMVWIAPGNFIMGSPTNEALRGDDETQHQVTLSHGFFLGQFLVTQGDYLALIGTNPSFFTPTNGYGQDLMRPVEEVSWNDAINYCTVLTQHEQLAGRLPTNWVYRLPTESEWEYAARAGTTTAFYFGNQLRSGMANFDGQFEYDATVGTINNSSGTYLQQTTPVGSYEANLLGLYDMCGNLYQWCQDWYGPYPAGNVTDPQGQPTGTQRVLRNNGWNASGQYCRSAQRGSFEPTGSFGNAGFRIILSPNP